MKRFVKHLFKHPNQSYLMVWMHIWANTNEQGEFEFPYHPLLGKYRVSRSTLRRIIKYGTDFWNARGTLVDTKWSCNQLKIIGLTMFADTLVDTKWTESGQKEPLKKKKKSAPRTEPQPTDEVTQVVEYLNTRSGKSFRPTNKDTIQRVKRLLKEGYVLNDIFRVIDVKCKKWIGTKYESYLRPQTLFSNKFESYLNENEQTADQSQLKFHNAIAKASNRDYSHLEQTDAESDRVYE